MNDILACPHCGGKAEVLMGVILMGIFAGIWTLCGWLDWRG